MAIRPPVQLDQRRNTIRWILRLVQRKTHIQFIREQLTIIMTYEKEIR